MSDILFGLKVHVRINTSACLQACFITLWPTDGLRRSSRLFTCSSTVLFVLGLRMIYLGYHPSWVRFSLEKNTRGNRILLDTVKYRHSLPFYKAWLIKKQTTCYCRFVCSVMSMNWKTNFSKHTQLRLLLIFIIWQLVWASSRGDQQAIVQELKKAYRNSTPWGRRSPS